MPVQHNTPPQATLSFKVVQSVDNVNDMEEDDKELYNMFEVFTAERKKRPPRIPKAIPTPVPAAASVPALTPPTSQPPAGAY